ncbi:MAG TPA: 4a-hydroxytetrahydrobiopterin dehydratase [Ktedonobacterales bacterium]|nr:4a-hydroxytetrahydrobiopterin dehydratase [Ktedonobacterales bacterium]
MAKLTENAIAAALASLPGWSRAGEALTKTYKFPTFLDGIHFVDRVALTAEELGHHPDITINYWRVTMTLTTHDEGGISDKDVTLAQRIDALAQG